MIKAKGLLKAMIGKTCARCGEKHTWTHFENVPTCEACELNLMAEREVKRLCPMCSAEMTKSIVEKIIVDRCPDGHGAWLDGGELELIQKALEDDAEGKFGNGLIVGMALG